MRISDWSSDVCSSDLDILGVPAEDEPRMLMLTQQLFGSTDPELNRNKVEITSAEQAIAMLHYVIADFEHYFRVLTAARPANPREDIATVIANATNDGGQNPHRAWARPQQSVERKRARE